MDNNEIDWYADIIPGVSIAGFEILKHSYDCVKDILEKLDDNIYHVHSDATSFEVYSSTKDNFDNLDLLMRLSCNKQMMLDCIIVYITRKKSQYQGKIYGKYGLGDRLIKVSEFGLLERTVTGEEFLLINDDNKYGLDVGNGLDVSLEEDPNQNIAVIRVHEFLK